MQTLDWFVLAGGAATIAWVNWYFFLAERMTTAAAVPVEMPSGNAAPEVRTPQEVRVVVRGGYDPATIRARAGAPLRLVFDRQESSSCSEEVVLPDFGIRRFLPTGQPTAIEITPPAPGRYEFTCGMGMLRGRILAE